MSSRLHSAVQAKQKDKQTISQLEKRLKAEQEARALVEKQLAEERKRKKMEEATAARAVALAAATRYKPHYFCLLTLSCFVLGHFQLLKSYFFFLLCPTEWSRPIRSAVVSESWRQSVRSSAWI